jgi:hypothetical protein
MKRIEGEFQAIVAPIIAGKAVVIASEQKPAVGIISAQSGEFIVPDVPSHTIIPLSPRLALVGSVPDGVIVEENLAEINRAACDASQEYFFARDFSKCPR